MKETKPIIRLVEDCSDLTLPRSRLADMLNCDDADIEARLGELGLECCASCGTWKKVSDCSMESPDEPGSLVCQACAKQLSVEDAEPIAPSAARQTSRVVMAASPSLH